ncbi:MAG TPA: RluA family pseudouridine synthase [Vicinamibacterales bacterium]|nr:RluA family pseudouridine synthase [Vicinamibacterales bacterium]
MRVLYEDDDLLVVDKPAGVVVHPSYKNPDGTLLDALMAQAAAWPPGHRPSIVGRLDKQTSGLVVVAKHAAAHAGLQRALASPHADKIYLAIVRGTPPASAIVDAPLMHDPVDRRRRIVSPDGAPSVTEFSVLESGRGPHGEVSLLRCRLRSGRRHQIRVHAASHGWPIVGDALYGEAIAGVTRHALHAWRVGFMHPSTRVPLTVEAPPPQDFCSLLYSCFAETTSGISGSAFFQFAKNRS